jgi:ABC-type phosphate transport system substrate-binding protein
MYAAYNHFKVSDMPLNSSARAALVSQPAVGTVAAVLQLPIAVGALGIFYNKAVPSGRLVLTCTLLARMYTGAAQP